MTSCILSQQLSVVEIGGHDEALAQHHTTSLVAVRYFCCHPCPACHYHLSYSGINNITLYIYTQSSIGGFISGLLLNANQENTSKKMARERVCYKDAVPFGAMVIMECVNVGLNTLFKAATLRGMSYHVFVVYSYAFAALLLFPSSVFFICRFFLFSIYMFLSASQTEIFSSISKYLLFLFVIINHAFLFLGTLAQVKFKT